MEQMEMAYESVDSRLEFSVKYESSRKVIDKKPIIIYNVSKLTGKLEAQDVYKNCRYSAPLCFEEKL